MQFELAVGRGRETVEAEEIVPGLAVHRSLTHLREKRRAYSVSHVGTGLGFGLHFRTEDGARRFGREIAEWADWTSMEPITHEKGMPITRVLREKAQAIQRDEDLAKAKAEPETKRLWRVTISTEVDIVVWAATQEDASDIAGDECLGIDPPEPEVTIDACLMRFVDGHENERPFGREDLLTCGDLFRLSEKKKQHT